MPEYRIMEVGPQGGRYNERRVFAPSASEALAIVREKTNGSVQSGRVVYVLGKVDECMPILSDYRGGRGIAEADC